MFINFTAKQIQNFIQVFKAHLNVNCSIMRMSPSYQRISKHRNDGWVKADFQIIVFNAKPKKVKLKNHCLLHKQAAGGC